MIWNGSSWSNTLAHDLTGITYDDAGNVTALKRYRENGTLIDSLTYTYDSGSNRLLSVTDAVPATSEAWDAEDATFTYDASGNLLRRRTRSRSRSRSTISERAALVRVRGPV